MCVLGSFSIALVHLPPAAFLSLNYAAANSNFVTMESTYVVNHSQLPQLTSQFDYAAVNMASPPASSEFQLDGSNHFAAGTTVHPTHSPVHPSTDAQVPPIAALPVPNASQSQGALILLPHKAATNDPASTEVLGDTSGLSEVSNQSSSQQTEAVAPQTAQLPPSISVELPSPPRGQSTYTAEGVSSIVPPSLPETPMQHTEAVAPQTTQLPPSISVEPPSPPRGQSTYTAGGVSSIVPPSLPDTLMQQNETRLKWPEDVEVSDTDGDTDLDILPVGRSEALHDSDSVAAQKRKSDAMEHDDSTEPSLNHPQRTTPRPPNYATLGRPPPPEHSSGNQGSRGSQRSQGGRGGRGGRGRGKT